MSLIKVNEIQSATGGGVTAKISSVNGGQLANRNMFVNGGMEVAQRLSFESSGKVVTSGTSYYGIDMFLLRVNDCSIRKTQSTDVPVGFCKSLKLEVTSADTSLAAGVFNSIVGNIEGYDIVRTGFGATGAKTLTLSFFVKSNLTGTFTGSIGNSSNNRSYAFDYTISSANTWERKTITFDGDTTGTWHKDNQLGLKVTWALGVGSNFLTSTSTTWQGAEHMGTTNGQNVCGSTSNNFFLTGVQLEVGSIATSFENRSFCDEYRRCCRYYQKSRVYGQANQEASQTWNSPESTLNQSKREQHYDTQCFFPNGSMRTSPTVSFFGSFGTSNQHRFEIPGIRNDLITRSPDFLTVRSDGFFCRLSLPTGTPDDNTYRSGSGNAFVRMTFDASAEF